MGTKAMIAGAVLCVLGLSLFAYGMSGLSNVSYAGALSNSYTIVVGIFIGMVGIFMLMLDLYSHAH